jgi:flagellar basal body-associated protein FliL
MFSLIYASYQDGKIAKNDGTANTQLFILTIILAAVWFLLTAMFIYYLIQFKKTKAQAKMYGWPLIGTIGGCSLIIFICWVLNLPFYLHAESIFGADQAQTAFSTVVALTVIGFVALLVIMIGMWFFIAQFAVALTNSEILFIGEKIKYSKITKIVKDNKKAAVYINYKQGNRTHKRQKFYLKSVLGQFILKNAKLTGHEVETGDESAYFKSAIDGSGKTSAKTKKQKSQESK